jgi:hypothetical protein
MLHPKSFVLNNKTKTLKNYGHFTKTLRSWCFLDTLNILQISQRGKNSGRRGSDIRDQPHIFYRMVHKTSKTKIHCKLVLGASYNISYISLSNMPAFNRFSGKAK